MAVNSARYVTMLETFLQVIFDAIIEEEDLDVLCSNRMRSYIAHIVRKSLDVLRLVFFERLVSQKVVV